MVREILLAEGGIIFFNFIEKMLNNRALFSICKTKEIVMLAFKIAAETRLDVG